MGKFINTSTYDTVDNLVQGMKHRLDNPFYIFIDKQPTAVTFYNVNDTQTTLDEGSEQVYDIMGPDSPIRFNKIKNTMLYGLEKIQTDLEIGEYGPEASDIAGDCIVQPNSFQPYPDSYFCLEQLNNKYWFRVTKVTMDTLENGFNFWKIDYMLEFVGEDFTEDIESRVDKTFSMVIDNVGSNYKSVVQEEELKFVKRLEEVCTNLSNYYHSLFFQDQIQTYVFKYGGEEFYNPEVIEFLIRNKVLNFGDDYVYIVQASSLPQTFNIQYDKSIFRNVETGNKKLYHRRYYGIVDDDPMSLLSTRLQDYYILYPDNMGLIAEPIKIYSNEFITALNNGIIDDPQKKFYEIIKNYFNDKKDLSDEMIDTLENIDYMNNIELYHMIPIILFILRKNITDIMELKPEMKALM